MKNYPVILLISYSTEDPVNINYSSNCKHDITYIMPCVIYIESRIAEPVSKAIPITDPYSTVWYGTRIHTDLCEIESLSSS